MESLPSAAASDSELQALNEATQDLQHPAAASDADAANRPRCRWPSLRLRNLPVQASGIALNVVAAARLLTLLGEANPAWQPTLRSISHALLVESGILLVLSIVRAISWRSQLRSRRVCSAHGALLIAIQLFGAELHSICGVRAELPWRSVVYAAAACSLLLCAHFLRLCWRRRSRPEPFWFPPTVGTAAVAIVGPQLGTPRAVCLASALVGCAFVLALWPPCAWRVLRYPRRVAPDPSVFVLMAPLPFVTLALLAARLSPRQALLGDAGRAVCFLLNCASVLVALFAAWQRRRRLRAALWPFVPSWASLTFPLVSSCTVAEAYAIDLRLAVGSGHASAPTAVSAADFSRALVALTLVVVPTVDLLWISQLPRWFFCAPPAPAESDDEAGVDKN
jgi:tellurite resistance protein TehA-like permease